jgi:DNA-binding MarR family transcriptional regulator
MSPDLSAMAGVDRLIHEPARLMIVTVLYTVEEADFLYLINATSLTKGNLSTHLSKLEEGGYVQVEKTYRGKIPQTLLRLTPAGRKAFEVYRNNLKRIMDTLGGEE